MLPRPLPHSLDPLPSEGLDGFLLRLSYRLERAPFRMARLTGLIQPSEQQVVATGLLLHLPDARRRRFAHATRLSPEEVAALCLSSMAGQYPPASPAPETRGWSGSLPAGNHWIFKRATIYCPQCLAGDGIAIQNDLGGPWRKTWRLAVVFACLKHSRYLAHLCPGCGRLTNDYATARGATKMTTVPLIPQAGRSELHPTQCRLPLATGRISRRDSPACGAELSGHPLDPRTVLDEPEAIDLQKHISNLLDPCTPNDTPGCGLGGRGLRGHVARHPRQARARPCPRTRDTFVPVGYCRLPPRATPKGLCKTILDIYGDSHPATQHDLVRAAREAVRDHHTTALLIDDITRLRLHRDDDQDTLDLIDISVTLVLIGVDIPKSELLRGARRDPRSGQWAFPAGSHQDSAAAQTGRRFDLVNLQPFRYSETGSEIAFVEHLAGIEEQLWLLNATDGLLISDGMPNYLYCRRGGSVGLLRRLIEDGCARTMKTGEERLTRDLLDDIRINLDGLSDLDPDVGEIPPHPRPRPSAEAEEEAQAQEHRLRRQRHHGGRR